jgi:hypothetical protein
MSLLTRLRAVISLEEPRAPRVLSAPGAAATDFLAAQRLPGTDFTFRPTTLRRADAAALLVWHPHDAPVLATRRGG